ncbi:cuticle protein AMP1A-like [Palaemon carinicauda]|uniref:cuticle protein AMP1A-like n=1 Tax=Palaemon carinicauda TaxID=392227 RepID=UPI0035B66590
MKFILISALAAVALAAPQYNYDAPAPAPAPAPSNSYIAPAASNRDDSFERPDPVAILRDDRVHEEDGRFNVEFEAENGIKFAQAGSPDGDEGSVVKAGMYSYTAPDGTLVEVKYVADENGFQPQSDLLPVAPAFPHPIPQFVLDQIAFAAEEDARRAREGDDDSAEASAPVRSYAPPSSSYGTPQ